MTRAPLRRYADIMGEKRQKGLAKIIRNRIRKCIREVVMPKHKQPKFRIFQGRNGQWYVSLIAVNGEIVFQSEGYHDSQEARTAALRIRRISAIAKVTIEKP